jgi:hypothetical protein
MRTIEKAKGYEMSGPDVVSSSGMKGSDGG